VALLARDLLQLPSYEALSYVFVRWLVGKVLHQLIERVSLVHSAGASLNRDNHSYEVVLLALDKGFLVIVRLAANRACFVCVAFVAHKSFETFETSLVVYVRTAENRLLLELQILEANWARFALYRFSSSVQEIELDLLPLRLTQRFGRLVDEAKSFCQAQFVDVLHPLLFNIVVGALLSLLAHCQDSFHSTAPIHLLSLSSCAAL
jgi:hypothetical protein